MASKKRTSRKPGKPSRPAKTAKTAKTAKPTSHGLSGNPQRRAEQLQERSERARSADRAEWYSTVGDGRSFPEPKPVPWWPESHATILARVRETQWPSRLLDAETLAGEIVGDELHARMNAPGATGLYPSRWLAALIDEAVRALRADLTGDGGDWPQLWAFLRGLHADALDLKPVATLLADRGIPAIDAPAAYQPAGDALIARDAYGSRFLIVASFKRTPIQNDPANSPTPQHWYAWDLDWCSLGLVVAAGPYDSADEALAQWRDAVGPAAAAAAELSPCPPDLTVRVLQPALALGTIFEMMHGEEPLELMHEYFRLHHRAIILAEYLEERLPGATETDGDEDGEDEAEPPEAEDPAGLFLDWHAGHAVASQDRDLTAEAAEIILEEWGPFMSPEKGVFYACSPHRIETVGTLIRDEFEPDDANAALRLLPDWTRWILSRRPIDAEAAQRSLEAARAQAALLIDETSVPGIDSERSPFIRQE